MSVFHSLAVLNCCHAIENRISLNNYGNPIQNHGTRMAQTHAQHALYRTYIFVMKSNKFFILIEIKEEEQQQQEE